VASLASFREAGSFFFIHHAMKGNSRGAEFTNRIYQSQDIERMPSKGAIIANHRDQNH
jgi:hypothetical protein